MGRTAAPVLLLSLASASHAQTVEISFDPDTVLRAISPHVYGTNQPDWTGPGRGLTMARWGGSRTTAYNWENNASNAGNDYLNQNDAYLGGGETPLGAIFPLLNGMSSRGLPTLVTIPLIGYVSADKNGGGDVNQTPDYLNVRFKKMFPRKTGKLLTIPNKTDPFVYADEMVFALKRAYPAATLWFSLDNEPDLWDSTHARLRQSKLTYAEIVSRTVDYGRAIRAVAGKSGLIFGPASYGWQGYVRLQDAPDAAGRDFLSFYLAEMRRNAKRYGRLVDSLDLHYYSEARGDQYRVTEDRQDASTVAARVQAPRSLYDPTFTEASWITQSSTQGPIRLIPRMREKIAANYPGTGLSFMEWNFGGGPHPSGAVATADAFGREGVFAACFWDLLGDERYSYAGLGAFRNFDGAGAVFGDRALATTNGDIAKVQIYAARNANDANRLTLVVINRQAGPTTVNLRSVRNFTPTAVRAFRVGSNSATAQAVTGAAFAAGGTTVVLPAHSVTTYEILRGSSQPIRGRF